MAHDKFEEFAEFHDNFSSYTAQIRELNSKLTAANARIAELEAELDQAIGVIEDRAFSEIGPEELRPCPFCGAPAHRVNIPTVGSELGSDPNAGGSYIECTRCSASSAIHFDRKEGLFSSWNDRARSALSEAPATETDGWRTDLENAPKTGADMVAKPFLGWYPDPSAPDGGDQSVTWWEPRLKGGIWYKDGDLEAHPTLWRLLPAPPAIKRKE